MVRYSHFSLRAFLFALLAVAAVSLPVPAAQATQILTQAVVPTAFKTCHKSTDCIVAPVSCAGFNRCCEYDSLNILRLNDYTKINLAQCKPQFANTGIAYADQPACTVCEPLTSHQSECINNMCVDMPGKKTSP